MNKVYKAHPLMILSRMKPFLFVLVLPFVRGLLQYITDREITSILRVEILLFNKAFGKTFLAHGKGVDLDFTQIFLQPFQKLFVNLVVKVAQHDVGF